MRTPAQTCGATPMAICRAWQLERETADHTLGFSTAVVRGGISATTNRCHLSSPRPDGTCVVRVSDAGFQGRSGNGYGKKGAWRHKGQGARVQLGLSYRNVEQLLSISNDFGLGGPSCPQPEPILVPHERHLVPTIARFRIDLFPLVLLRSDWSHLSLFASSWPQNVRLAPNEGSAEQLRANSNNIVLLRCTSF